MMTNDILRVAVVGLGYFSQFHLKAWDSDPRVRLSAVVDQNIRRAQEVAQDCAGQAYAETNAMLAAEDPEIVDLVLPPTAHAHTIRQALKPGRVIICQKPFCTSIDEATTIAAEAETAGTTLIIHENFRFQPWHRTIKSLLARGDMGQIYSARFVLRPGDGRGPDAYLARQPSFQAMERFLVQETAVHLIDTMQWLFGPVTSVYAELRHLNPAIKGEDAGIILLQHQGGSRSTFDGNRLADHAAEDKRRTMGEMVVEGEAGTLSLDGNGRIWHRKFASNQTLEIPITEPVDLSQFGGGCVAALNRHVVDAVLNEGDFENTAKDYLGVLRLVETAYQSNAEGRRIET